MPGLACACMSFQLAEELVYRVFDNNVCEWGIIYMWHLWLKVLHLLLLRHWLIFFYFLLTAVLCWPLVTVSFFVMKVVFVVLMATAACLTGVSQASIWILVHHVIVNKIRFLINTELFWLCCVAAHKGSTWNVFYSDSKKTFHLKTRNCSSRTSPIISSFYCA